MTMTHPKRKRARKRIVGEHFRADGNPKRRFETQLEAQQYANRYGHPVAVYHCSFCNGYHFASR